MDSLRGGYSGDTGRGPSSLIFKGMNSIDQSQFLNIFEDFKNFQKTTAIASNLGRYAGDAGGYITFEDTSCTIAGSVTADYTGAVVFTTDATDNNEVNMAGGDNTGGSITCKTTMKKLAFECRVRFSQIVTQNVFLGLIEPGRAVTDGLFTDADALGTKSILGWSILAAASSTMKGTHGINGTAAVQESTITKTIAASTWYKFGVLYEPASQYDGYVCKYFVDGVNVGGITTEGSSFPASSSGVVLTPGFFLKNSAAAANVMTLDWYRVCAQLV